MDAIEQLCYGRKRTKAALLDTDAKLNVRYAVARVSVEVVGCAAMELVSLPQLAADDEAQRQRARTGRSPADGTKDKRGSLPRKLLRDERGNLLELPAEDTKFREGRHSAMIAQERDAWQSPRVILPPSRSAEMRSVHFNLSETERVEKGCDGGARVLSSGV